MATLFCDFAGLCFTVRLFTFEVKFFLCCHACFEVLPSCLKPCYIIKLLVCDVFSLLGHCIMLLLNSFNKNVRNLLKGRHMKSFLRRGYNELKFEDVPEVSSLIIKKVLNKNNVSFEEGYTSFIITCSMCHKNTKKPLPVYINKMTGTSVKICSLCSKC